MQYKYQTKPPHYIYDALKSCPLGLNATGEKKKNLKLALDPADHIWKQTCAWNFLEARLCEEFRFGK